MVVNFIETNNHVFYSKYKEKATKAFAVSLQLFHGKDAQNKMDPHKSQVLAPTL